MEESYKKMNIRLKRKIAGEKQQAFLKELIGSKIYYKLMENGGIVLDGDGRVVEFRVWVKDSDDLQDNLLYKYELKQLSFNIEKLKSLPKLTEIDLYNTRVFGDIIHLKSLPKLDRIDLWGTGVYGDIAHLKSLRNLTMIDLRYTGVTGNIKHLKSLPKLTEIYLNDTGVTGNIKHLKSLPKLRLIWIRQTGVSAGRKIFREYRNSAGLNSVIIVD